MADDPKQGLGEVEVGETATSAVTGEQTAVNTTTSDEAGLGMLYKFPGELRNAIYQYVAFDHPYRPLAAVLEPPALLLVSKQVKKECAGYFDMQNAHVIFQTPENPLRELIDWLNNMSPERRKAIRRLTVLVGPLPTPSQQVGRYSWYNLSSFFGRSSIFWDDIAEVRAFVYRDPWLFPDGLQFKIENGASRVAEGLWEVLAERLEDESTIVDAVRKMGWREIKQAEANREPKAKDRDQA